MYLLTVRNRGDAARRLRLAPYFQMVLAAQPEHAGPLQIRHDAALNALFFENPRNTFRTGPAFVALSVRRRARGDEAGPLLRGRPRRRPPRPGRARRAGRRAARRRPADRRVPDHAGGPRARRVHASSWSWARPTTGAQAEAVIRKYRDPDAARAGLEETRRWWLGLMDTVRVQTSSPEFDRYLDWLKYQALAERIWARRGFYQASGAFGFRDQLQDSVNLIWMDPALARRQILLHASQQFLEGDVVHWFHRLQDGRTGFVGRTHASDNLLWLAWGVVEYVAATGDDSLLDERTPYLEAEQPFEPLPAGQARHGVRPAPVVARGHRLPALPEGDRPGARPAHGGPRAAADRHRRLERRAGRDRQPGPGRERLARLLPLLHPRPDGRHRGAAGGPGPAGLLPRAAAAAPGRPGAHLAGRPLPAGHPRRRHRDRRRRAAASGRSTP